MHDTTASIVMFVGIPCVLIGIFMFIHSATTGKIVPRITGVLLFILGGGLWLYSTHPQAPKTSTQEPANQMQIRTP